MPLVAYSSDDVIDNSSEAILENESSSDTAETLSSPTGSSSPGLTYSIIDPTVPAPATTRIVFDDTNIVDCTFEYEGLTVVKEPNAMIFDITATNDFGTFEMAAEMSDGNIVNETIYTYSDGSAVYTSEVSKDTAWHKCKEYEFDNYLITSEKWHRQYSEISHLFVEEETNYSFSNDAEVNQAVDDGKIVVRGMMTWETENGTVLPMVCTKIDLRDWVGDDSRSLSTTYTDSDGYYCFILDPNELTIIPGVGLDLFVRTCIESETFIVLQPYFEGFNYFDSPTILNVTEETGVVNVSRRIKNDIKFLPYQLTYIQQGMVIGQNFAIDMGMEPDKKLYVFYIGGIEIKDIPENTPLSDFINLIYDNAFCYDTCCFIGYRKYNNFFVPIHEYGHYVENRMGNYGSAVKGHLYECIPDDFNGTLAELLTFIGNLKQVMNDYSHVPEVNNFSKISPSDSSIIITKEFQMELTWSEAWATAFAKIAFQQCGNDYQNVLFDEYINYETNIKPDGTIDPLYDGEAQEYAVASFLWDLYDFTPSETDDNIYSTKEEWWELTTQTGTYTLQDFTNNILDNYPELIDGVGEILSKHQISPNIVRVTNEPDINTAPSLEIKFNVSSSYPNNKFKIAFYDEEYNLLFESNLENVITATTTHTVADSVWNTVMEQERVGAKVYAVIYGYRYETSSSGIPSGPYFSSGIKVYDANGYHSDHAKTYISVSASSHSIVCSCGSAPTSEAHYSHRRVSNDSLTHNTYCICGYLVGTHSHSFVMLGGTARCRFCSYVRPTSQVILGKKEENVII